MATMSETAKQELNALNYITGKLDGLPVSGVLRVLSWARAASAGTEEGGKELAAMRAIAGRLGDVAEASSRTRILHWLDEHYLADDENLESIPLLPEVRALVSADADTE